MSLPKETAWFPAKTYGWGWGLPCRWQGWVATVAYVVLLLAGMSLLPERPLWYGIHVFVISSALIGLCAWKGESPRWSWGKSDKP